MLRVGKMEKHRPSFGFNHQTANQRIYSHYHAVAWRPETLRIVMSLTPKHDQ